MTVDSILIAGYEMKCVKLLLCVTLLAMDTTCSMGLISGESDSGSAEGSAEPICKWFVLCVVFSLL